MPRAVFRVLMLSLQQTWILQLVAPRALDGKPLCESSLAAPVAPRALTARVFILIINTAIVTIVIIIIIIIVVIVIVMIIMIMIMLMIIVISINFMKISYPYDGTINFQICLDMQLTTHQPPMPNSSHTSAWSHRYIERGSCKTEDSPAGFRKKF